MKTEEQATLLMIQGTIYGMPEDQKKETEAIAEEIRKAYKGKGAPGLLALALVGAEAAL